MINLYIYQPNPRVIIQLVREWIERAGPGRPLDIALYSHHRAEEPTHLDENVARLVEMFNEYSSRWEKLTLQIPFLYAERVRAVEPLTMFKYLRIHQEDFVLEPAVHNSADPSFYRQQRILENILARSYPPGLPTVKNLSFTMVHNAASIFSCLFYGTTATNVETLAIRGKVMAPLLYRWAISPPQMMSQPITRPCLRKLVLDRMPYDFVLRVLAWVRCPNLETLLIYDADLSPTGGPIFQSFLSRCSKSLKALTLGVLYHPDNCMTVHDGMLSDTLAATPSVQHLSMHYDYFCPLNFREPAIFERLLEDLTREVDLKRGERPVLPVIQSLKLGFMGRTKWAWESIPKLFYPLEVDTVKKRDTKFLPSQRPIRSLGLVISNAEGRSLIDLRTLKQLSEIAQRRRVQFCFVCVVLEPGGPRNFNILQESAAAHGLVWKGYLRT